MWTDDGPIPETHAEKGLVITQILSVRPGTNRVFRIGWPMGLTGSNRL
jgi:hypothetical protein